MVIYTSSNCVDDPSWYLHHGDDIGLVYKNIFIRCIYNILEVFLCYPQVSIALMESPWHHIPLSISIKHPYPKKRYLHVP
jgi:hypothetical protein